MNKKCLGIFRSESGKVVRKRIFMLLSTIFFISLISFFLIFHSPGEMARLIFMEKAHTHYATDADVAAFAKEHGLNVSAVEMYFRWVRHICRGDLGNSLITGESVLLLIHRALPKTLGLTFIAFVFQLLFGFGFGFYGAYRPRGFADKISEYWGILSLSLPPYWLALLLLWFCTVCLKWTFVLGYHGFVSLWVPGFLLGVLGAGGMMRLVKSKTSLILKEGYIEYAVACGISKHHLLFGHVFKNALPSVLAYLTQSFIGLLGGSVLIEKIFSIPGIGLLAFRALEVKDIFLLSGIILYLAIFASIVNLLSDCWCIKLDRRSENALYQR